MYIIIEGSAEQDEVTMSRFNNTQYADRSDAIRDIRAEIENQVLDECTGVEEDNVTDNLESVGEITINMYDGYGETLYKVFEV